LFFHATKETLAATWCDNKRSFQTAVVLYR